MFICGQPSAAAMLGLPACTSWSALDTLAGWSLVPLWVSMVSCCAVLWSTGLLLAGFLHKTLKWSVPLQLINSLWYAGQLFCGCTYPLQVHLLFELTVSCWMEHVVSEAAVNVVRSVSSFSLAFWCHSHLDSSSSQWERRALYVNFCSFWW